MRKTRLLRVAAAASAVVLVVSGCGSDETDDGGSEVPGGEAVNQRRNH